MEDHPTYMHSVPRTCIFLAPKGLLFGCLLQSSCTTLAAFNMLDITIYRESG